MLLGMDEYPFHQIAETFAGVAGADPQWNDGHYVCLCDADGRVCLTSNLRLYQNNDVVDGFVCVRHDGRQHNLRVSRRLRPDIERLGVGPLLLEIVVPMHEVRLVLDENEHGLALDVTCRTTVVPHHAPPQTMRVDGRVVGDRVTYEVVGVCDGWVQVGGQRIELRPESAAFFRNHSWGNQPGRGGPRHGAPTPRRAASGMRQWVLLHLPSHGAFVYDEGRRRPSGAILLPDRAVPVVGVDHDLAFYDGGRRLRGGTFTLHDREGGARTYDVDDLGWVYCQGGGYFGGFDDGLGQGVYRGDEHVEGEVWDVSHPTQVVDATGRAFELEHAWAESFVRVRHGDESGLAHHECVVFSPAPAE